MADIYDPAILYPSIAAIAAMVVSGAIALVLVPFIMRKMKERGIIGEDWNKKEKIKIPELGGIAILFAFSVGASVAAGILKLTLSFDATPILAAIGVLFIAGMIGIIDDISNIPQRLKAIVVAFAALPLIIAGIGIETINLPFGLPSIDFSQTENSVSFFWLIIVPIAVTGAANAMNMSAGYNGLETGQIIIISISLLVTAFLIKAPIGAVFIFAALMGAAAGLNYYNGYPAMTFVGDVGTLSMGSAIAAGAIIGNLELAGLIAIGPTFYELGSTVYHSVKKINRKPAMANPIIDEHGRLHVPKGAEKYTLAYYILSKKPMTERNLVRTILGLYIIAGILAILFSVVL